MANVSAWASVVERGGRPTTVGGDDLAPAARQQRVRLALVGRPGGVAAEVADADPRVEHGRGSRPRGRAGTGPCPRRTGTGAGRTARGGGGRRSAPRGTPRSPSRRSAAARRGRARRSSRSGVGSSGGWTSAGSSAPTVPGSGCAERCTEPSGFSSRGTHSRPSAARAASARERAVEQLAVRVEQHGHGMPRPLDAGVVGRAEARVAAELDDLRAAGAWRAPARRRTSRCRRRSAAAARAARRASASSAGSGPAESWRTTTIEKLTPPPPPARRASAARSRPSSAARSAPGPPRAAARGAPGRPASASSASARRLGVAGRHVQRPVAEHLAEHRQVADDRRRTRGEPLDRRQPEALEPRRQHDGERARVERAEVVDPAEPPDARARADRAGPRRR